MPACGDQGNLRAPARIFDRRKHHHQISKQALFLQLVKQSGVAEISAPLSGEVVIFRKRPLRICQLARRIQYVIFIIGGMRVYIGVRAGN